MTAPRLIDLFEETHFGQDKTLNSSSTIFWVKTVLYNMDSVYIVRNAEFRIEI